MRVIWLTKILSKWKGNPKLFNLGANEPGVRWGRLCLPLFSWRSFQRITSLTRRVKRSFHSFPYTLLRALLPASLREMVNQARMLGHTHSLGDSALHWLISEEAAHIYGRGQLFIYLFVSCMCFSRLITYTIRLLSWFQKWKKIINWIHMEKPSLHPRPHRLPTPMLQVHTLLVFTAPFFQGSQRAAPAQRKAHGKGVLGFLLDSKRNY